MHTNWFGMVIVAGLLALAGFSIVDFMVNFARLQRVAEESAVAPGVAADSSRQTMRTGNAESGEEHSQAAVDSSQVEAWLAPLNRYRAMVGLAPVVADTELSRGDSLHSHYLAVNYAPQLPDLRLGIEAHSENPAKPGFTAEGAAAAQASDIDWFWDPHGGSKPGSWAIADWMRGPFHRMPIISPYLHGVGYGSECQGAVCFAALNAGSDVARPPTIPSSWPTPLAFPPDGSVVDMNEFSGEWPDPLTSCTGYVPPAGLPVTLEFGHLNVPGFSDYSIKAAANGARIEACAFDANSYVNPDPVAQTTGRAILRDFGAIVIVPRRPLSPGRYLVSVAAPTRYSWSFSVVEANRD